MRADAADHYTLKHIDDASKDCLFRCKVVEENGDESIECVILNGTPPKNFEDETCRLDKEDLKLKALGVLQMHLDDLRSRVEGLRPREEIAQFLRRKEDSVKTTNPFLDYTLTETVLYRDDSGKEIVRLVHSSSDRTKLFAMKKSITGYEESREKERMEGESLLLASINSDYIVKAEAIYNFEGSVYVLLEYMDGGALNKLVTQTFVPLTEDFVKYSLYRTAKGIQALHTRNVLHRDIKSDNVLCNLSGEIKVADLGVSIFLCE